MNVWQPIHDDQIILIQSSKLNPIMVRNNLLAKEFFGNSVDSI